MLHKMIKRSKDWKSTLKYDNINCQRIIQIHRGTPLIWLKNHPVRYLMNIFQSFGDAKIENSFYLFICLTLFWTYFPKFNLCYFIVCYYFLVSYWFDCYYSTNALLYVLLQYYL